MHRTHSGDRIWFVASHHSIAVRSHSPLLHSDFFNTSHCHSASHFSHSVPTMFPPFARPHPHSVNEAMYLTPEDPCPENGGSNPIIGRVSGTSPNLVDILLHSGIVHNRQTFEPMLQPYAQSCELDAWRQLHKLASKEIARLESRKQPRPFSSIPTDVFHIVISFLTFREMAPLCRVSKELRRDFESIASELSIADVRKSCRMKSHEIVHHPQLKSPMAKHIKTILLNSRYQRVTLEDCLQLNAALNRITTDLPHLHGLEFQYRINLPPLPPLSTHLRSLCLMLTGPSGEALQTMDETVGKQILACLQVEKCHALETFFLKFSASTDDSADDISCDAIVLPMLQHWPNLTHLRMNLPTLSPEAVAAIRTLPHLRTLDGGSKCRWDGPALELLTAEPCPFVELHDLRPFDEYGSESLWMIPKNFRRTPYHFDELTQDVATALARLPAFRRLLPITFSADPMTILPALINLAELQLYATDAVDIMQCVRALSTCTNMQRLRVKHTELTDAHMEQITSCMPLLFELIMRDCHSLAGLSFLSNVASLSRTLTQLSITTAVIVPADIEQIGALTSIETIAFDHAFSEPPSVELYARFNSRDPTKFQPNLLPCLKTFSLKNLHQSTQAVVPQQLFLQRPPPGTSIPCHSSDAIRKVRAFLHDPCDKGHRVIFTHNFDAAAPFQQCPIDCQIEYWQALRQNTENELTQLRAEEVKKTELEMIRPWQAGLNHVMPKVAQFLSFHELTQLDRLCRSWHASMGRLPARPVVHDSTNWCSLLDEHLIVQVHHFVNRHHMARSNLAPHVHSMELKWPMHEEDEEGTIISPKFTLDQLSQLYNEALDGIRNNMHHLLHLTLTYPIRMGARGRPIVPLPTSLRELDLVLVLNDSGDNLVQVRTIDLIRFALDSFGIAGCTQLCKFSLKIKNADGQTIEAPDGHAVLLQYLRHWPNLTSLNMDLPGWSDVTLNALRGLPHLRALCPFNGTHEPWTTESIEELTRPPNPFTHLEYLDFSEVNLTTEMGTLLTERFPNLQNLNPEVFTARPSELLPQLLELRTLHLSAVTLDLLHSVEDCIAGLIRCTKLEDLTLKHPLITGAHMHDICSHLPFLCALSLLDCNSLVSLAFLSTSPFLSSHLLFFSLETSSISLSELDFLLTLDVLRCLRLQYTVEEFTPKEKDQFVRKLWEKLPDCRLSIDVDE